MRSVDRRSERTAACGARRRAWPTGGRGSGGGRPAARRPRRRGAGRRARGGGDGRLRGFGRADRRQAALPGGDDPGHAGQRHPGRTARRAVRGPGARRAAGAGRGPADRGRRCRRSSPAASRTDGLSWRPLPGPLELGSKYTVDAVALDGSGRRSARHTTFTTYRAAAPLHRLLHAGEPHHGRHRHHRLAGLQPADRRPRRRRARRHGQRRAGGGDRPALVRPPAAGLPAPRALEAGHPGHPGSAAARCEGRAGRLRDAAQDHPLPDRPGPGQHRRRRQAPHDGAPVRAGAGDPADHRGQRREPDVQREDGDPGAALR